MPRHHHLLSPLDLGFLTLRNRFVMRAMPTRIASNRINDPDVAEALLAGGAADLVSMARPLLADPDFAKNGRARRRNVTMLQRKADKLGADLGTTTGSILKARLRHAGVEMISGASYTAIDDRGLHDRIDGERRLRDVDHVVICAGQESDRGLQGALVARGAKTHLLGDAKLAAELGAARAIDEATRRAAAI